MKTVIRVPWGSPPAQQTLAGPTPEGEIAEHSGFLERFYPRKPGPPEPSGQAILLAATAARIQR
jgi:hypothetical protein